MEKQAKVNFRDSESDHDSRYIHKYYLPQEFRRRIFPVDITAISTEYFDCYAQKLRIPKKVPGCVIHYRDICLEKHLDGETVRRVLLAIAAFHADIRGALTPEENWAAMNLNTWFMAWEKELLTRCIQLCNEMEQRVRSNDGWLTDYECDVEIQLYVRDDDPYSGDNMSDGLEDDIDSDTSFLCEMKLLVCFPILYSDRENYWGIGDDIDHNDRPRGIRKEEIYNVRHCATFHELFDHTNMPVKHAGRIGHVFTDIIIRHQNGIKVDLKGEQAVTVRDEQRIREWVVLCGTV